VLERGCILGAIPGFSQSIDCINSIELIYRALTAESYVADLKLKDLRYLVAVADTRHFGRAAERTFVSQPTLSAQLKKLEQYLGVQLIERAPKRVSLTPAGEEVVERARVILEASDEIVELSKGHRDPLTGRLKVAFLPTIGPYLLPLVAAKLRKALPRLELMLYEYQTGPMLEKLHSGEIDVGILALPVPVEGLEVLELYREPFTVALPSGHRLAQRNSISVQDLGSETLLLLEDGHCLRDQALEICSTSGMHEKQDFRATSLETLRQMVAAGVGITLLPELASRGAYGNARGVVIKPFTKPTPTRTIGLAWRKSSARRVAIMALAKQISAHTP
jgi:LysR family transcriptional regulator, hydrogen peroxide-inducible genes activator